MVASEGDRNERREMIPESCSSHEEVKKERERKDGDLSNEDAAAKRGLSFALSIHIRLSTARYAEQVRSAD